MARKSHSRKHHKRASRKTHKRVSRKTRSRKQQGGGSCAYMPQLNRQMVQMGGMAPMESAYGTLLDGPTAVQAQVGPLNTAFAELPGLIPKQHGGRRRHSRKHRSRKHRRYSHRGGMHPFDSAFGPIAQQPAGANNQFMSEGEVNALYGNYGPQHKA